MVLVENLQGTLKCSQKEWNWVLKCVCVTFVWPGNYWRVFIFESVERGNAVGAVTVKRQNDPFPACEAWDALSRVIKCFVLWKFNVVFFATQLDTRWRWEVDLQTPFNEIYHGVTDVKAIFLKVHLWRDTWLRCQAAVHYRARSLVSNVSSSPVGFASRSLYRGRKKRCMTSSTSTCTSHPEWFKENEHLHIVTSPAHSLLCEAEQTTGVVCNLDSTIDKIESSSCGQKDERCPCPGHLQISRWQNLWILGCSQQGRNYSFSFSTTSIRMNRSREVSSRWTGQHSFTWPEFVFSM